MKQSRLFQVPFSSIYPLYVEKLTKKNRTEADLDTIISWLTGYSQDQIRECIKKNVALATFFDEAPHMNEATPQITGVICGVRVEEIDDPMMQKIRYLDKLVDELARGKAMEKVLRQPKVNE